jgi:hypothetical protein
MMMMRTIDVDSQAGSEVAVVADLVKDQGDQQKMVMVDLRVEEVNPHFRRQEVDVTVTVMDFLGEAEVDWDSRKW